jgi:hypothetical protein
MDLKKILVCITNYNDNDNALKLKSDFSKYIDTIIIDSGSKHQPDEFDIKLSNIFYTGLYNESINQCIIRNKEYLYFIASDVFIDNVEKIVSIISELNEDIYLWAPSSKGQSHQHCKNKNTNAYRNVAYLEGFTFLVNINVCNEFYPIDRNKNFYGYGIDILLGFITINNFKKLCVVDDRVEVYHREGTGYNQNIALQEMYNWFSQMNKDIYDYIVHYSKGSNSDELIKFIKSKK